MRCRSKLRSGFFHRQIEKRMRTESLRVRRDVLGRDV
jgi:hypothetical protein